MGRYLSMLLTLTCGVLIEAPHRGMCTCGHKRAPLRYRLLTPHSSKVTVAKPRSVETADLNGRAG